MARDRSDTRWSQAKEPWQRLTWARSTHGSFSTPTSFSRTAGVHTHTYAAYERDPDGSSKHIKLGFDQARAWADLLDVRWEWLLRGDGLPWRDDYGERAKQLVEGLPADRQAEFVQALEVLARTGTGG